jgi:hypothetical protein
LPRLLLENKSRPPARTKATKVSGEKPCMASGDAGCRLGPSHLAFDLLLLLLLFLLMAVRGQLRESTCESTSK